MTNRGVTLVEVATAVSVVSILIAGSLFSYQGWVKRYRVEKVTKELYADLMKARVLSLSKKMRHYAVLEERSYSIVEDSDDNGKVSAGDTLLPSFPRLTEYFLYKNNTGNTIFFQKGGLMSNLRTIWVKTTTDVSESMTGADYDCMKVSAMRIVIGRYDGSECVPE